MYRYVILMCFLLITLLIYFSNVTTNSSKKTIASIELKFFGNITVNSNEKLKKNELKNFHVPKFMLELYESSNVKNKRLNYSFPEVVRSVIPKSADILKGHEQFNEFQDNHLLIFDVPSSNDDEVFLSAELKVLTLVDISSSTLEGVKRLVKISIYNELTQNFILVDKLKLNHTNNTWISINVTDSIHDILNRTNSNRCLKVVISIKHFVQYLEESSKNFRLSLLPINENYEHDYPVLLLSYDVISKNKQNNTINSTRFKRSLEEDYEEETNKVWDDDTHKREYLKKVKRSRNACKRKPLYVNFSEIQYDTWIVQPRGYEAYQCQGKCFYPVADHLSPTKHAIVQALLHSLSPGKASRSCCVPTKLSSISVLYVDNNGVLTYRFAYQDMVVLECGCR